MSLPLLKFPNKSHRKTIALPRNSTKLAELIGIIFGDGGINNNWQLVISLNSVRDVAYSHYIIALLQSLFNISVSIRKRPGQNTLILICSSMSLLDFLVTKGAVRGNKILQQINIPHWIKKNTKFKRVFVRGLVDTDGCLFIHKHVVKNKIHLNIGFCFTSFSQKLISTVAEILTENNIQPHVTDHGRRIYLYSEKAVTKYLSIFGSSNPRIISKYNEWRDARVA